MENVAKKDYKKGFIPFAIAAFMIGLSGGFTAGLGPAFVSDLGIAYNNATWISLALAMSTAACAPILGKLGDVYGRRKTLLTGIAIFILGNILTALAPSLSIMLVARFIVGIGTAAVMPTVMSYIVTEYPPAEMGKGFGLFMLVSSSAVVIGPTMGGLIMESAGWRVMMWVTVAICFVGALACYKLIDNTPFEKKSLLDFDKPGAALVIIFFSLFLCVPSLGQNMGWTSMPFIIAAVVALVSLICLVAIEKKAKNPILNGAFIARKQFIMPVVILFLTQGLLQANMTNVIVFIKYTQPENTIISSLAISIMYIGMCIGSIVVGPMADKKEPKRVLTGSLIVTAIGCGLMYLFKADSSIAIFAASLGILGFGLGGNATILMKVVLNGLSAPMAGSGTGIYNLFRDISAPFGVAVLVPLFTNSVAKGIGEFVAGGGTEAAAALESAVMSIKNLALIEVACVIIGIVVVQMLPKIYVGEKQ